VFAKVDMTFGGEVSGVGGKAGTLIAGQTDTQLS